MPKEKARVIWHLSTQGTQIRILGTSQETQHKLVRVVRVDEPVSTIHGALARIQKQLTEWDLNGKPPPEEGPLPAAVGEQDG